MGGFLVPEWYHADPPSYNDISIISIVWGFSLGTGLFTASLAFKQSWKSWKRQKRITPYVALIWAEWVSSVAIGIMSWTFLRGIIEPSFWFFFFLLLIWVVQIQCLLGIIVNRIALLTIDHKKIRKIRWSVAILIGLINISVFCIYIPARLQISPSYIEINRVWDRVEKGIFCIIDAALNFYFMRTVKTRLIANGLTKYEPLFRFNLIMVTVSISLDVILIGVMSLPNDLVYIQFHPLTYLLKLHIEMNIAELITKVVQASNPMEGGHSGQKSHSLPGTLEHSSRKSRMNPKPHGSGFSAHISSMLSGSHGDHLEISSQETAHELKGVGETGGIHKKMETTVTSKALEEDEFGSDSSSTRKLHKAIGM